MNARHQKRRGRPSAGLGAILLLAGVGWSFGFAGESLPDKRREALSQEAFEKILPALQSLNPNDSLLSLEGHRQAYRDVPDTGRAPIVLMPGWISALSGSRLGGLFLLGEVTGRSGAKLFGTHVFGYLLAEHALMPSFLVFTEATLISEEEYSRLPGGTQGTGLAVEPGSKKKLSFRDLHVRATRVLSWVGQSKGPVTVAPVSGEDVFEWFFSQQSYQEMEEKLRSLAPGTGFWDVLASLGALVTSEDLGDHHTFQIRGYVTSEEFPTKLLTREDGVYSIWPFGYVKRKRVMPQLVLVFKNDQLLRVSPFTGKWNVSDYVAE